MGEEIEIVIGNTETSEDEMDNGQQDSSEDVDWPPESENSLDRKHMEDEDCDGCEKSPLYMPANIPANLARQITNDNYFSSQSIKSIINDTGS